MLYEYQPSRKAKHAEKFLEEFSGYLHADGYQGYYKLPRNIRVVGCWAHARRKFDEALNALLPDKREGTAVLTGLEYCNQLFTWEERFKELSPEDRTKQRLKEEKPILDALLACADSVSAAPKSALGKALHYRKVSPAVSVHTPDQQLHLHGILAPPCRKGAPLHESKERDLYNWRSTGNCDYINWRSHHAKLSGDLETG